MTTRETSINTYHELKEKGKIDSQMSIVFEAMQKHDDICINELSEWHNIPINAVCGRIGDLKDLGLIFESQKRESYITNRINITYTTKKENAIKKVDCLSDREINTILKKLTTKANTYQINTILRQCENILLNKRQTENKNIGAFV